MIYDVIENEYGDFRLYSAWREGGVVIKLYTPYVFDNKDDAIEYAYKHMTDHIEVAARAYE